LADSHQSATLCDSDLEYFVLRAGSERGIVVRAMKSGGGGSLGLSDSLSLSVMQVLQYFRVCIRVLRKLIQSPLRFSSVYKT
jgi:hypothetical protein